MIQKHLTNLREAGKQAAANMAKDMDIQNWTTKMLEEVNQG